MLSSITCLTVHARVTERKKHVQIHEQCFETFYDTNQSERISKKI